MKNSKTLSGIETEAAERRPDKAPLGRKKPIQLEYNSKNYLQNMT
jgi:hypothetical protein